jgi:hypothetical protein
MWEIRTAGQHDFHASTAQLNIETSPNACRHFLPLAKASNLFFFQHSRQLGSTTAHPAEFSASQQSTLETANKQLHTDRYSEVIRTAMNATSVL